MLDFGIKGRKAIVCASSKGLGFGCAQALAKAGVDLVMCARGADLLERSAQALRDETGVSVTTVACDVTTEDGRAALLDAAGDIDILVNNAGGPPPGNFRDWTREDWIAAIDSNMLSAIELTKALVDPMIERRFGRIVNITSGAVKNPIPALGLSNAARAGLTGFVAGVSREVAAHNVTINGLLPGQFNTDRIETLIANSAKAQNVSKQEMRDMIEQRNPTKRLGEIHEFGFACAWICSAHSGYLTGQNILIDGGVHNATI
ncbi:MAG: SDR family oxidoreductase [Candidatus Puniceispirillaceae bacterium]